MFELDIEFESRVPLLRTCLATAEILYHMPDYPDLLQTYIWQNTDLAPELPALKRFLEFWERNLDGRLHSVRVTAAKLVRTAELCHADAEFRLH
ncbi:MAG: Usg family protein [Alphaproteobacteria bacterium]|nr:Usg family protein [Alphaproteobacteria bacterium]